MKLKTVFLLTILISLFNCARRGNPSGGIKDEGAPIIINAIPLHNTTNFDKKEVRIYFDEYIKLKDLQKQLVISPPLKYKPIISPLGIPSKRITIKITDTLKANTTYVFNFGESIEDNNEGNKLSNFKYVFSTGKHIDSLHINGTIKDAFLNKTDDYVSILLYDLKTFNDSTVFKEKPMYVANTLDSLGWEITNIKKGDYKIIALKETQNNLIYNPKQDKIAFIDSVISIPTKKEIELTLFKNKPGFKLSRPIEISKGHLLFGFEGNGKKLKAIAPKNLTSASFFDQKTDSLHFFYKGKDLDSIKINFKNTNFSEEKTIKLRLNVIDSLVFKNTIKGVLHPRDTFGLLSNNPLEKIDISKINLTNKDTINIPFTTKITNLNKLNIIFDKKPEERYNLEVLPSAITDFFDQKNDSLNYKFSTKKDTYYGSLVLKIITKTYPIIIQLLTDKNTLVQETYALTNSDYNFESLEPGKYIIRVISDTNKNGEWDTGNYSKNVQPEKVRYFNKTIEIKENWFLNETFDIE